MSTIRPGGFDPGKKISYKQSQTWRNVGFSFEVGPETSETAYRNGLRTFLKNEFLKIDLNKDIKDEDKKKYKEDEITLFRDTINQHLGPTDGTDGERKEFLKLDAQLKQINSQINDTENKQSNLEGARQISSITNSPYSGLTEKADMKFELDTVGVKMDGLKKIRDSISAARNESGRKISVCLAGINECNIILGELAIFYGDAAPKERR